MRWGGRVSFERECEMPVFMRGCRWELGGWIFSWRRLFWWS